MKTCWECERERPDDAVVEVRLYDTPWKDAPRVVHLCIDSTDDEDRYAESCLELLTDTGHADFRYFECEECQRMVCRQNPRNGWHSQVRVVDEAEVCLRCYERRILADGVEREELEAGRLSGMFFSGDNHELTDAGFEQEGDYFVNSTESARRLTKKALALMDEGRKVIIAYERLAIGGSEGYVSLWSRGT